MRTKVVFSVLIIALVGLAIAKLFVFDLTVIQTNDMAPTLMPGDLLLANKLERSPRRGQLVLFEHPSGDHMLVRRVIALPGETFSLKNETPAIDGLPAIRRTLNPVQLAGAASPKSSPPSQKMSLIVEQLGDTRYPLLKDPRRRSKSVRATSAPNGYFVMSDNRNHGVDSRELGHIPAERIRAVITHRLSTGEGTLKPAPERKSFERMPW